MLYVGHFSFHPSESATREIERGSFTCLVEANDPDTAIEKFQNLIESLDDSSDTLDSVGDIFLDNFIEVKNLPDEGILTRYEELSLDGMGSISTTLPDVPEEAAAAYGWGPEDQDKDEHGGVYVEPFMHGE